MPNEFEPAAISGRKGERECARHYLLFLQDRKYVRLAYPQTFQALPDSRLEKVAGPISVNRVGKEHRYVRRAYRASLQ